MLVSLWTTALRKREEGMGWQLGSRTPTAPKSPLTIQISEDRQGLSHTVVSKVPGLGPTVGQVWDREV